MMAWKDNCILAVTACKILSYKACCCCLRKERQLQESCTALMLGFTDAGKTTLLTVLCQENHENVESTNGFLIKDVVLPPVVIHVKEVGGSDKLRQYWHHYYDGVDGIIYVIDGTSKDDLLRESRDQLLKTLESQSLAGLPLLVLINKVEHSNGNRFEEIARILDLSSLCTSMSPRSFLVDHCDLNDIVRLRLCFEKFASLMLQQMSRPLSQPTENTAI